MATLTVVSPDIDGGEVAEVSADAGGDEFANDGNTFLRATNGSGGALTLTFDSQQDCSQGFNHDVAVAVAAGESWEIGPFPTTRFNDPATGRIAVSYSAVTSLTVVPIRRV